MHAIIHSFFALLLLAGSSSTDSRPELYDHFDVGLSMLEQGKVETALNVWLQAKTQMEDPDPRIGFAFIETATSERLKKYYEFASYMYDWGLMTENFSRYKNSIAREVERLKPLIGNDTYREWKQLLETDNPEILKKIKTYWERVDPTIFTDYNERLLEHWERIAYAREHFNRSSGTTYGTDSRGLWYIRYGLPDEIEKGRLGFDVSSAKSWVSSMLQSNGQRVSSSVVDEFVNYTREFYTNPEYEIWVYRGDSTTNVSQSIYLFGTHARSGSFELLESVEDFIPNRAFSMAPNKENLSVGGIRPGLILQMMYYSQLAPIDSYFATVQARLENSTLTSGMVGASLGQQIRADTRAETESNRIPFRQISTYENQMVDIPMQIYQYRLLDENNEPILATFFESRPQRSFWVDYLSQYGGREDSSYTDSSYTNGGNLLDNYRVLHGVKLYDSEYNLSKQVLRDVDLVVGSNYAASTVMTVPHLPEEINQVFIAELYNYDPTTRYNFETPFPQSLRGLGKKRVPQPEPLEIKSGELAMGDIIMGYDKRESNESDDLFPFVPANRNQIPAGKNLTLHLELYNLALTEDSTGTEFADFTITYQMKPVSEFLAWTKKQEEKFKITLNFKTDERRFIEDLEIVTRELLPGRYSIQLAIEQAGNIIERTIPLELTDNW